MKNALLLLIVSLSTICNAGGYMGVNHAWLDADEVDFTGVNLVAGYAFNDVVGIEGRTLINSSAENYRGIDLEIDKLWGLYATLTLPILEEFNPYIIFGHSEGEVTASYQGQSASADDSSTSLGFGVKYNLREQWSVRAEYLEVFDDIESFSVGLNLNF